MKYTMCTTTLKTILRYKWWKQILHKILPQACFFLLFFVSLLLDEAIVDCHKFMFLVIGEVFDNRWQIVVYREGWPSFESETIGYSPPFVNLALSSLVPQLLEIKQLDHNCSCYEVVDNIIFHMARHCFLCLCLVQTSLL